MKGGVQVRAEVGARRRRCVHLGADALDGLVAHEAGDRQRHAAHTSPFSTRDQTALHRRIARAAVIKSSSVRPGDD